MNPPRSRASNRRVNASHSVVTARAYGRTRRASGRARYARRSTNRGESRVTSAAELAGFFAAHAVWCVSDGETLIPMLATQTPSGERKMERLADELLERAVETGKQWLADNREGADRAVLIYDGFLTLPTGKTDALFLEIRVYSSPPASLTMAVPYRHAKDPAGFAVFKPKFLASSGADPDYDSIAEAFFSGVDKHEQGSAIWNRHIDQSR